MRVSLSSKYNYRATTALSVEDLKETFLGGINTSFPNKRGEVLEDTFIANQIELAQRDVERVLDIKLTLQKVSHSNMFYRDDWNAWGFIPVSYPVVCPVSIAGFLGNLQHILYPKDWMSARRSSDNRYFRKIYLTPYSTNAQSFSSRAITTPFYNIFSTNNNIPNYWNITYITGYDIPPIDLVGMIGKLTAINVLSVLGDIVSPVLGASSYSISLDGLSQNTSTVANAKTGIYGARINQLQSEIVAQLPQMIDYYKGINFIAM